MVTSSDVAKLAQVSQTTVCRAFRDNCYISPKTKSRIMEAAETLGYYPNYSAKSLKKQKSLVIGLLLSDAKNTFFSDMIEGIDRIIDKRGYRLMLAFSDDDPAKERRQLEYFISSHVSGVIYMPVSRDNEDIVRKMNGFGIKLLQFSRDMYDFIDTFTVDDNEGAYMATTHLLQKGHRRILITDYENNMLSSMKVDGYLRAYADFELEADRKNIIWLPQNMDMVSIVAGALSERNSTAILTTNLSMTLTAICACQKLGLSIPDDISLVAYDDNEWLGLLGITSVAHQMEKLSVSIANVMMSSLENLDNEAKKGAAEKQMIKPFLMYRASVKNLTGDKE